MMIWEPLSYAPLDDDYLNERDEYLQKHPLRDVYVPDDSEKEEETVGPDPLRLYKKMALA